ncbi:hypothetical protein [Burkholderia gladioli]|uniref:hypothetical protein n=1 Tax=Burkholderia gladioli TaxID=28095 RepID=UPI00163EFF2E|nr:hypothetical protein [Burkholderia gladioli]
MQPQTVTNDLIDLVNRLQESSRFYIDTALVSKDSQSWRAIKRQAEALFKVDAKQAWEIVGMLEALKGDRDAMEAAFSKSLSLGLSESNHLNLMVNRLNLGLFSAAQQVYSQVGSPEGGKFSLMIDDGLKAGAIFQAHQFVARAQDMKIEWEDKEALTGEIQEAAAILEAAGIDDSTIGRRLDLAGEILHRHRIRPGLRRSIMSVPGEFVGVAYRLFVPATAAEAFAMNLELAEAETAAGIESDSTFEVVFEARPA